MSRKLLAAVICLFVSTIGPERKLSSAFAELMPEELEAACGKPPLAQLVVMKPWICNKQNIVWEMAGFGMNTGQSDVVQLSFAPVAPNGNQRVVEADVSCACTAVGGDCYTNASPAAPADICPAGYAAVVVPGATEPTCEGSARRSLPIARPPMVNSFTWTEGPFRVAYESGAELNDAYIAAVKDRVCGCERRPTHIAFFQSLHARCFDELPLQNDEFVTQSVSQMEASNGANLRCEITDAELARVTVKYQECVNRLEASREQRAEPVAPVIANFDFGAPSASLFGFE